MIISLNWLKKYINVNIPTDELAALIGARLVEIEEVIDLGAKYKGVLVVKVVQADKLEGSDHLSVVKIDDNGVTDGIERDNDGLIQVVCGAPNVRSGLMVAWLPPGSIVPQTFNTADQFVLDSRKLRGVISNGMIASARELDLFDEHEGILELDDDIKPGNLFTTAYEMDDYLLDIENKSLTHRPDCFGIIGFAREVAAIQGNAFKTPEWLIDNSPDFAGISKDKLSIKVSIDNSELSDRYIALVMSNVDANRKSPLKFQTYLSRVGIRPINAVVDVTNYLMMLTGQPLHAFDYDKVLKVSGGKADIHVRSGNDGEKLGLLDGRVIELSPEDIVIAAGDKAIALAGAMGGAETEVDENTSNIIIESATFNLYNLRATQMRHGIFSEAITRFTKGQPAELAAPVLLEAVHLMGEWSGAECVSDVVEAYPDKRERINIEMGKNTVNNILGTDFTDNDIVGTLQNVEFTVETTESTAKVAVPYWRADINIVEDIVEEIGRLNGFDNINPTLPTRNFTAISPCGFDDFRSRVRDVMVRGGANEVLSYSFVHGDMLKKAGHDISNSYRIVNSISPDLQYYRQTLTPSLLGLIHPNIKNGYDKFSLFEINKTHQKRSGLNDEKVPVESDMMSLVMASKNKEVGAAYYSAKRMLDYLCQLFDIKIKYEPIHEDGSDPISTPFESRRSAKIIGIKNDIFIGVIGEYKKSVARAFKLPEHSAGFELDMRALFDLLGNVADRYSPISRYPSSERDICFKVDEKTRYQQIVDAAETMLKSTILEYEIHPVDIYQPVGGGEKNITVRIRLTSHDYTLTSSEVTGVIDSVIETVISMIKATVI